MKIKTATCPKHGVTFAAEAGSAGCHECVALAGGPVPEDAEDRVVELEGWCGMVLTVPFDVLHGRIESLMGRPVWTHELADTKALVGELRGIHKWEGPVGSAERVAPGKPIITVRPEETP